MVVVLVTVLVVVVKLMQVLIDGRIGITGITTSNSMVQVKRNMHTSFDYVVLLVWMGCGLVMGPHASLCT